MAKNKGGRPSKFDEANMALIQQLAEYGHTDKFIAEAVGVTEQTFNNWKKDHPQFFESLKDWKADADNQVEKALFERAKGYNHEEDKVFQYEGGIVTHRVTKHYPPDTTACIFWLKNRRPDLWRDKVEHGIDLNGVEGWFKNVSQKAQRG